MHVHGDTNYSVLAQQTASFLSCPANCKFNILAQQTASFFYLAQQTANLISWLSTLQVD
jgi:hypothetical protein